MYSKFVHAFYYFNIVVQSIFSLLCPVGLLVLVAWLLTDKGHFGEWIYVPLILFGLAVGLCSMVRFILSATAQISALEKAQEEKERNQKERTNARSGEETEL